MSLALLLALPFIGSAIAALLPSNARNAESTWSAAIAAAALVRVAFLGILAPHFDVAAGRGQETDHVVEQRALSASAAAHDHEDLAPRDRE